MSRARIDLDAVMAAVERDDGTGFCMACGAEADGCEPDAEHYPCRTCGAREVAGADLVLILLS